MGIAAAVSVPDGVAVASDSRIEAGVGGGPAVQMSDTQQKIVPVSRRVAVIAIEPYFFTPDAAVNTRSILEQIRPDLPSDADFDQVLSELPGRFKGSLGPSSVAADQIQLRFIGYSEADRAVNVAALEGLDNDPRQLHATNNPGVDWFGEVDVATRLIKGSTAIETEGVSKGDPVEYIMPFALMSLDDALDLAAILVQTTTTLGKFVRAIGVGDRGGPFRIGAGGPVQSAVGRPDGFQWVSRPSWAWDPADGDRPVN